jgi:hypothetical protein
LYEGDLGVRAVRAVRRIETKWELYLITIAYKYKKKVGKWKPENKF